MKYLSFFLLPWLGAAAFAASPTNTEAQQAFQDYFGHVVSQLPTTLQRPAPTLPQDIRIALQDCDEAVIPDFPVVFCHLELALLWQGKNVHMPSYWLFVQQDEHWSLISDQYFKEINEYPPAHLPTEQEAQQAIRMYTAAVNAYALAMAIRMGTNDAPLQQIPESLHVKTCRPETVDSRNIALCAVEITMRVGAETHTVQGDIPLIYSPQSGLWFQYAVPF